MLRIILNLFPEFNLNLKIIYIYFTYSFIPVWAAPIAPEIRPKLSLHRTNSLPKYADTVNSTILSTVKTKQKFQIIEQLDLPSQSYSSCKIQDRTNHRRPLQEVKEFILFDDLYSAIVSFFMELRKTFMILF